MKTLLLITLLLSATPVVYATDNDATATHAAKQKLLKRIYQARIQLERERQNADNQTRNNAPLIRSSNSNVASQQAAPTVYQLRRDTAAQLARFEQNFRCLDVDVENNGGNTVVICGNNSGDVSSENTSAGRDLINHARAAQPSGRSP